jgi:hypothetical protein
LDSKITKENDLALKKTAYDSQCAKLLDSSKGMVLRYQQTGKKPDKAGADEKYSEIGFYSQPTSWKANKDKEDYRAFGTDEKSKDFPKIDRINIKSTGDIYSDAVNYQGIRANRMEISVGKGKTLGAKAKRGVLSIEAGDEIELKSDTKITLTVGKSSITIDDTGIYLATNKVTGPYSSAWETMLNLTPADGIMGGGSRVKFNAVNEVQLAEGYGGSFAAHLGVTRIGGLDIKLATENILEYGVTKLGLIADTVINGVILAAGIIAEGVAITADIDKQKNKLAAIIGLPSLKGAGVIVKSSVSMADKKMAGEWASLAGENDQPYKDSAGALSGAVSIAVQIASAIATVLSFTVPKWFEGQDKAAEKANLARSSINMALLATETGLSLAVVSAMVAQGAASVKGNAVSEDTFHLQFGGMIHNESYNNLSISTEQRNYKNPLAGFDLKGFKPMGKQPLIQMFTKLVKPVMLACQKAGVFNNKELENL